MTGMVHAGASVMVADSLWGVFFCRVSGLSGVAFAGVLGLAGEDCGVTLVALCLKGLALRLVPVGRALSKYL